MMIIMLANATPKQVSDVIQKVEASGLKAHVSEGTERVIIGLLGNVRAVAPEQFEYMPGIDRIVPISRPYKIASRELISQNSVFPINGIQIGGDEIIIMAGPCAVEDRPKLLEIAHAVREAGGHALRGGAFKPRTSPYSFQGLGLEGLQILAEAARPPACRS